MKVLLINGSPHEHGCTDVALCEVAKELEANGVGAEIFWLGTKPMQDCIACGSCKKLGRCVFDDDLVNKTAARMDEFDALVIGSPVYYGGPNGRLTAFMDRLLYSADGAKFDGKLAACVVSCRRGGATASFERLNQFFLMKNMHVVGSQYWNQIHGATAEDALKDEEGLQTMRTLAKNMAYLLKCQEAGAKGGVEKPVYEPHLWTNFIR